MGGQLLSGNCFREKKVIVCIQKEVRTNDSTKKMVSGGTAPSDDAQSAVHPAALQHDAARLLQNNRHLKGLATRQRRREHGTICMALLGGICLVVALFTLIRLFF